MMDACFQMDGGIFSEVKEMSLSSSLNNSLKHDITKM